MQSETRAREVRNILRYIFIKCPAFATLALWCPWTVTDDPFVSRTDGHTIRLGAGFFAYLLPEQAAILVRAVLHIALCHLPRSHNHDPLVWNLCANIALHEEMKEIGWLVLPAGSTCLQDVMPALKTWVVLPPERTAELVYDHLIRYRQFLDALFPPGERDLDFSGPLLTPYAEQVWSRRLARACSEERPHNLLIRIAHDFPTATQRWDKIRQSRLPQPLPIQERPKENTPLSAALFEAAPGELFPQLPTTAEGLYDLAHGTVTRCESLEAFRRASDLFARFDQLPATAQGLEIQTLAMELLLTKAHSLGLLLAFTRTPEYHFYRNQAAELFEITRRSFARP